MGLPIELLMSLMEMGKPSGGRQEDIPKRPPSQQLPAATSGMWAPEPEPGEPMPPVPGMESYAMPGIERRPGPAHVPRAMGGPVAEPAPQLSESAVYGSGFLGQLKKVHEWIQNNGGYSFEKRGTVDNFGIERGGFRAGMRGRPWQKSKLDTENDRSKLFSDARSKAQREEFDQKQKDIKSGVKATRARQQKQDDEWVTLPDWVIENDSTVPKDGRVPKSFANGYFSRARKNMDAANKPEKPEKPKIPGKTIKAYGPYVTRLKEMNDSGTASQQDIHALVKDMINEMLPRAQTKADLTVIGEIWHKNGMNPILFPAVYRAFNEKEQEILGQ